MTTNNTDTTANNAGTDLANAQQGAEQLQDIVNNPSVQQELTPDEVNATNALTTPSTDSDISSAVAELAAAHLAYSQSAAANTTGNTAIDLTNAQQGAAQLQDIVNNPPVQQVFTTEQINAARAAIAEANALTPSSTDSDIGASLAALAAAQLPYAQAAATNLQIIVSTFHSGVTITSNSGESNTISSVHAGSSVTVLNPNISFNVPGQDAFDKASADIAIVSALTSTSSLSAIQSAMLAVTVDQIPFIQSTSIILECILYNPSETTPEQCQQASQVLSAVQALTTSSSVVEINQVGASLLGFMTQFSAS